jgi:hypothetical protein
MTDEKHSQPEPDIVDAAAQRLEAAGFGVDLTDLVHSVRQLVSSRGHRKHAQSVTIVLGPRDAWVVVVPSVLKPALVNRLREFVRTSLHRADAKVSVCILNRWNRALSDDEQRLLDARTQWLATKGFPEHRIRFFGPIGVAIHAALTAELISREDYDTARHGLAHLWSYDARLTR